MALDEPKETDETFNEKGITFLVDKTLFEEVKPINVDYVESAMGAGFSLTSNLQRSGGGCGSSCGSC